MATKPEPHIIDVDLKQSTQFKVPKVTQGDTATFFLLRVTDDGRSDPELLDYFPTITLTSERPDGKSFYVLGTRVEGTNEVLFHLGTDETFLTGSVRAAVQLYSVDGRNTSAQFRYEVEKDLSGEYVPSEREGSLIEQVLVRGPEIMAEAEAATLEAIKAREELTGAVNGALADLQANKKVALDEMSTAVDEANTTRDGANAAASRANQSADDTDQVRAETTAEREATETVRQNTETERQNTAAEREATERVRSSVEELIPQTEQARDGANAAGEFATEQGGIAQQQSADQLEQMGTVAEQLEYIQEDFLPAIAESQAQFEESIRNQVKDPEIVEAHDSTVKDMSFISLDERFEGLERDGWFPLNNLIKNGGFLKGSSEWNGGNLDASWAVVGSNSMVLSAVDGTAYMDQNFVMPTAGNKIYFSATFRALDDFFSGPSVNFFGLRTFPGSTGNRYIENLNTPAGTVKRTSLIFESASIDSGVHIVAYSRTGEKRVQVDGLIMLDLTDAFGAGNEPTKEEMDALLAAYPNNWFDGTVNLAENKKLLPFLLNQLRRKANRQQESWIKPTLINGATEVSPTSYPIGYYKDTLGRVHIRGALSNVPEQTIAFVLPDGYRPQTNAYIDGITVLGNGSVRIGRITGTIYLDSISFRAE